METSTATDAPSADSGTSDTPTTEARPTTDDELQKMKPDEPLVATVLDPQTYTRVRGRSTSEIGSGKNFHADCPCCGYRFAVDHSTAEQAHLTATEQTFKRKVRDKIQAYFTDNWKWKTFEREFGDGSAKFVNRSRRVRSASVDAVYQTGISPGLAHIYKNATRFRDYKTWFAVLWHKAPVIGEMFFACRLADLFNVLQAIGDDSPEFAYRLRVAADNALKRDGSAARSGRDGEIPAQGTERGVEGFDPASAVRV